MRQSVVLDQAVDRLTEAPSEPTGQAASTGSVALRPSREAGFAAIAGDRELAALNSEGAVVSAAPESFALFKAQSADELTRRLTGGDGPTARRLRRLAATLPIGASHRLERMSFTVGRRPIVLNLRLMRSSTAAGEPLLVLFAPGNPEPPAALANMSSESPTPATAAERPNRARFLWAMDGSGHFNVQDFLLRDVLGANSPGHGEALDALLGRVVVENGDAFAEAVGRRKTFSDLILLWPAASGGSRIEVRLSGAPIFGRAREFCGFRGYGSIQGNGYRDAEASEGSQRSAEPAEPADVPATHAMNEQTTIMPMPEQSAVASEAVMATPDSAVVHFGALDRTDAMEPAMPAGISGGPRAAGATQERSAAIYILRQTGVPNTPRVVPMRPSTPDPPVSPDALQTGEAVELSKSERDAFREIARALVGRTPASRADHLLRTGANSRAATYA